MRDIKNYCDLCKKEVDRLYSIEIYTLSNNDKVWSVLRIEKENPEVKKELCNSCASKIMKPFRAKLFE
jgi:hypothetical protein